MGASSSSELKRIEERRGVTNIWAVLTQTRSMNHVSENCSQNHLESYFAPVLLLGVLQMRDTNQIRDLYFEGVKVNLFYICK